MPERRFRGAQDPLPHAAGDSARQCRQNPERFGIVKVWRPEEPASLAPWSPGDVVQPEPRHAAE